MSPDRYRSYAELAAGEVEGIDFRVEVLDRGTPVAIFAPHAGGIEPGASELARALAGDDLTLYLFEGLKMDSRHLHLTSVRFDEPRALALANSVETILSVHGCREAEPVVYVGGLDKLRIASLIRAFGAHEIPAVPDNSHHSGTRPANLCNRGLSGAGVQLEISEGLRRLMFKDLTRRGRQTVTPWFHRCVAAARSVLV